MKRYPRLNSLHWILAATLSMALMLCVRTSRAGSATWRLMPSNNDWNASANWTVGGPPNGPSDTATFSQSNTPGALVTEDTEVNGIVFDAVASPFTIKTSYNVGGLTISGAGIMNNSGNIQEFIARGGLSFRNNASSGSLTHFWMVGAGGFDENSTAGSSAFTVAGIPPDSTGYTGGVMRFRDSSTAANGTFIVNGFLFCGSGAGGISFSGTASAGQGAFTINAGAMCGSQGGGLVEFLENATAANATFTNKGGTGEGQLGGTTVFRQSSNAGNAIITAEGGSDGGTGGSIVFNNTVNSVGSTARVEVFGDGNLISEVGGDLVIGSIEGDGNVVLGASQLVVGGNDLSTTFSGVIQNSGGVVSGSGGRLMKGGTGTLTLSGTNTYDGGTVVTGGTLEAAHDGALGAGNVSIAAAGAILTLQGGATNNYIADDSNVSVANGSTLNLNFSGTPDTVGSLLLSGVVQPLGVYGSAASGAPHQSPQFTGMGTIQVTTTTSVFPLTQALSRKTHGAAGDHYINLPLSGEPGVECRSTNGNHTLIFTFNAAVVSGNAAVTSGIGTVVDSPSFSGNYVTVNLTAVADVQTITVTLSGMTDTSTNVMPDTAVSMNVLAGDTSENKVVNGTDVSQTKLQSGSSVENGNFREDVNANGSINGTDVSIVKSRSGAGLP